MKKSAAILFALIAIIMMACNSEKKQENGGEPQKSLVLYYSQTDNTAAVAEELQKALGADIERIEAEEPYDGTYDETIERCLAERESGKVPAIKPLKSNIADYDVIFLGYPIWFGTYARPILGLLETEDFAGKKIVPFCTFGSGGLEASAADLQKALPKAEVLEGYGVRGIRIGEMPAEVSRFLIENGYVDGTVEPLAEFSNMKPVTDEETAIFDAACGDYQFPLGTPVSAGKRDIAGGTEYKYTVDSTGPDGKKAMTTVFIVVKGDEKPVFTKVVR